MIIILMIIVKNNKIIIPWQITIHFTFFFSLQNVCMFFHVIETNSYCAAFFFLQKKITNGVYA